MWCDMIKENSLEEVRLKRHRSLRQLGFRYQETGWKGIANGGKSMDKDKVPGDFMGPGEVMRT